jgi:hypothetical protein
MGEMYSNNKPGNAKPKVILSVRAVNIYRL